MAPASQCKRTHRTQERDMGTVGTWAVSIEMGTWVRPGVAKADGAAADGETASACDGASNLQGDHQ